MPQRFKITELVNDLVSVDNLLLAWQEFIKGKRQKADVQLFQSDLMDNIIKLHDDLIHFNYRHGFYQAFSINDPKPRNIHKATVRDRLVHHAIYRVLYPFFDQTFIFDSYSCRLNKGTHKAINRFRSFAHKVSQNKTKTCWTLKCDIKKFFANIDQAILIKILKQYIPDKGIVDLLEKVIKSFSSFKADVGLPLGNLTSQLLVNVYMNEFDQFVKHQLKAKYYLRYADDFLIMSRDRIWLETSLPTISGFLIDQLKLQIHPDKVFIKTRSSGVDFLGWIHFPDHRVLRTATKRRMLKKITDLGMLKYGNSFKLREQVLDSHFRGNDTREKVI